MKIPTQPICSNRGFFKHTIVILMFQLLFAIFLATAANAETLNARVDNGIITLSSENLQANTLNCNYTATYSFNIPSPIDQIRNTSERLGECNSQLSACNLEKNKLNADSNSLETYKGALDSCNKQSEIASYERVGFIAVALVVLIAVAAVLNMKKREEK